MQRTSIVVAIALCLLALSSCKSSKTDDPGKTKPSEEGAIPALAAPTSLPASDAASRPTTRPSLPKELTLDLGKGVTMNLAMIPAGEFLMGSRDAENGRGRDEGPQRQVTISKAFYMGRYEVTQEQYEAVMGANPSHFKGAQNPVEMVSWHVAVEFCKKLSQKTGKTAGLPTEAQWEYACRAGTKTSFEFGDDDTNLHDYAWYWVNSESKTHPVGQKKPNAWGLYDMPGNVWEWCSDWHADSYANAGTSDPQGPGSGTNRVLRGGSWHSNPRYCRSASRLRDTPDFRFGLIGFRVAVDSN
ncbi:MAG: formylglycine-generating enzyme family protein [Planctomycetota bacterium]